VVSCKPSSKSAALFNGLISKMTRTTNAMPMSSTPIPIQSILYHLFFRLFPTVVFELWDGCRLGRRSRGLPCRFLLGRFFLLFQPIINPCRRFRQGGRFFHQRPQFFRWCRDLLR